MAWVQSTGDAMVDPGAPPGKSSTVGGNAVSVTRASEPIAGYTIVEADDLDTAVGLVLAAGRSAVLRRPGRKSDPGR
jgi:hypothetical protein